MNSITKAVLVITVLCFALSACNPSDTKTTEPAKPVLSQPDPITPDPVQPNPIQPEPLPAKLSEADGSGIALEKRFMALEGEQVTLQDVLVPVNKALSETQALLSKTSDELPMPRMWEYQQLLPKAELFCQEPSSAELQAIAKQLGGFKTKSYIRIEKDATAPYLLDGFEQPMLDFAGDATGAINESGVSIQRPNVVARSGDKVFYLSDTYGLIYIDLSTLPEQAPTHSCALPLPGNAKNFVVTDDSLIVLTTSFDGNDSAILQFSSSGATPEYLSSILLKNTNILDARLFNNTLALYLGNYEKAEDNYHYRKLLNHQLQVVSTEAKLSFQHSEVLLPEGQEDAPSLDKAEQEQGREWSYFNDFLSASGEYLVVSKSINKSIFTAYETKKSYRCTQRETREYPYTYCNTIWDRQENPAYVAPSPIGTLKCSGSLASCLKTQGPSINKYIYVATGQECHNSIRYRSYCTAGHYESYQVPQYRREDETQFVAFRFADGQFTKLENQLATVVEGSDGPSIQVTDKPFIVEGLVSKHDHLNFIDDRFYAITKQHNNNVVLHTLSIQGNAAIYIDSLILNQSESVYNLAAQFTENKIYLSDTGQYENSDLQTISLSDPLKPTISSKVNIPTKLDQLLFANSSLLGFGKTSVELGNNITNYLGSITAFDDNGLEQNSLLLGSEYQYFSSSINYDDQVLSLDAENERVLFPYTVSAPLEDDLPYISHRLTLADFSGQSISQEHTFELPQRPERTLSLSKESALAFSKQMIHSLSNVGEWKLDLIFDGLLPESIYYSRNYPVHVQKFNGSNQFQFDLIDSPEGANGKRLARLEIPKAKSGFCTQERVYFDQDRLLLVQEKPNTYSTWRDCPEERSDAEKIFTAYKITDSQFDAITDQAERQKLYDLIQLNMYCITDVTNKKGKMIEELPDNIDDMQCYSAKHYYDLRGDNLGAVD